MHYSVQIHFILFYFSKQPYQRSAIHENEHSIQLRACGLFFECFNFSKRFICKFDNDDMLITYHLCVCVLSTLACNECMPLLEMITIFMIQLLAVCHLLCAGVLTIRTEVRSKFIYFIFDNFTDAFIVITVIDRFECD